MQYWVISDPHLGHHMLVNKGHRPERYETSIIKNVASIVTPDDVMICLGDVAFYQELRWHEVLTSSCKGKKWLVKGNHDKKSNTWYLDRGWDFVGDQIVLRQYGLNILLSHIPVHIDDREDVDVNVHGHLHDNQHRSECEITDRHRLVYMEHHYQPKTLRNILGK